MDEKFRELQQLMLDGAAELVGIIMERGREGEDRLYEVNGSVKIFVETAMAIEGMTAETTEDGSLLVPQEFLERLRDRANAN